MLGSEYRKVFVIAFLVVVNFSTFLVLRAQTNPQTRDVVSATAPPPSSELKRGSYYALVIGIDHYEHGLPKLETPVNDATEISEILRNQYGFKTQLLLDTEATREHIVEALEHYRASLSEEDSLLIYYGGHGFFDKGVEQAYWAPVDAGQDTYAHWIIATEITGPANAIPARQVLIISDSCYSGMLTRDASPDFTSSDHSAYAEKMRQKRSRHLMSSGGNEPVQDSDASGHFSNHSVFANVLLRSLSDYQESQFTGGQLFVRVQEVVGVRASQVPQYNLIRDSRYEGGDFVFTRIPGSSVPGSSVPGSSVPDSDHNVKDQHTNIETMHSKPFDRILNSEQEGVLAALNKYTSAFSSMDIRNLKQAWPSMTPQQEKETKKAWNLPGLRAVMVELRNPKVIKIDGDSAAVDADQWMDYTFFGRQQPPQTSSVEIQLVKNVQGGWFVNGIRGR